MEFDEQLELGHFTLSERKCRVCGQKKDLMDGFYLIRKGRGTLPSAYSYECKECTKNRILKKRKDKGLKSVWEYPDW